jgi:hypothetical protein
MAQKIVKLLRLTGHSHVERQASVRSSSWCRPCHARLDQLQNCDLTTLAQMYEVVVATSEAERSLTKVSEAVQNCGVDIVLSSMHFAAQSLTSGHTVLSLAPSCDICSMHPREASTSEVCHLHFIACDLLGVLPSADAERALQDLMCTACDRLGVQPSHVAVSKFEGECEGINSFLGANCPPPAPYLSWQRPQPVTCGVSKCPLSHFECHCDGAHHVTRHGVCVCVCVH